MNYSVVKVRKEGILLEKTNHTFENEGVLNPAVMQVGTTVHLFYRAVREGNHSTIGYCLLDGPLNVICRDTLPIIGCEGNYESKGVEDPRTVCIDGTYYLTYTAYDGVNALGALALSKDLRSFEKKGIIVPEITFSQLAQYALESDKIDPRYFEYRSKCEIYDTSGRTHYVWNKDLLFFPRRIKGKLVIMHRIKPHIQLAMVSDLKDLTREFWEDYCRNIEDHVMMKSIHPHESAYLGGGCPPIETGHGWINIYHGVCRGKNGLEYSACAALFDLDNPMKELSRLPYPLFAPEFEWEKVGEVNNVCFPTGTALFGDTLYIYYGAADERVACASVSLSELVNELVSYI